MNAERRYEEGTHIDERKLREFIFSKDKKVQHYAISSLTGMVIQFRGLPPCIRVEELVDLALDSGLGDGPRGEEVTPIMIQKKTWTVLQRYIAKIEDISPLLRQVKKRMKKDVEIHGGGFLLEICGRCIEVGKISNDIFAVLAIGLKSPSVAEHNKSRTLELIEEMIEKEMDIHKLKRVLKQAADGKLECCPRKTARGIYIEAASANFNKPPNWFIRKRNAFRMWRYSEKKTVPPPPMKIKRNS